MPKRNGTSKSKEELQREVEAKREEIAYTVDEIRTTLTGQVRERKQAVQDAMEWRYYVRKNPVACMGGAMAIGFFVGKLIGDRIFEHHEPDHHGWRDRADHFAETAERKVDEWTGRAQGESKWKARTRSAMSSSTDLIFRELAKTAQHMIIPTVVAAVTGKMASDNKTTIVEKDIHQTPGAQPDIEITKGVREYDGEGRLKKSTNGGDPYSA